MSLWKRGGRYWTDFTVDGVRYRKPLRTKALNVAKQRERETIETARHGKLASRESGPRTLFKAIEAYFAGKKLRCSARTIELEQERLSLVKKHFDDIRLSAIAAARIVEYQQTRHDAGKSNRTINMDVGVLLRVLKAAGRSRLGGHFRSGHLWTVQNRPLGPAAETGEFYFAAASARKSVWSFVRQLRGPHLSTCA